MTANMDAGVLRSVSPNASPRSTPLPVDAGWGSSGLDSATERCRRWLIDQQRDDGHWVGELEGDSILESEYILLMAFLGRERDPACVKIAKYLYGLQCPHGGWAIYPGGPLDISASVKAYFALKLVGMPVDHPAMTRAREAILQAGGAQACNSFTRFYLALLGQIEYDECPSVPPELVLLPARLGFSLYAMSAWTRTIVVPLSIISSFQPVRRLQPQRGIGELFRDDLPRRPQRHSPRLVSWTNFFLAVDRGLKLADRVLPRWLRRPGISAAHRWILEHLENSDGLGAIFPPMIYTVVALECLGYDRNSAPVQWALRQLEDLLIEEGDTIRVQPCASPVWDTALATIALADAGVPRFHPALTRSVEWLLAREVETPGDLQKRSPRIKPAGWHFQYRNALYPDIDDTAMVLLALHRTALRTRPDVQAATCRALDWILALQNRDGGWAAFDVGITNEVLTRVPFADHNAMLDPSCADITARVIELLGLLGYDCDSPAVRRGLQFLWDTQEPEGCWYGRWGVNYIYGTWQVLLGLRGIGYPMDDPRVQRAIDWLIATQQAGGGWGETCESYDDPTLKGQGTPTASQTAWAVLGLIAAGRSQSEAVAQGIEYLLDSQNVDGTWDEEAYTGTGFPRVFYLKYHLYRIYFPLIALSRYRDATANERANPGRLACRIPALPLAREV